ncbi:hypothetical protein H6G93_07155 [Nostoc sp. FACHB-973]|nr:hypothetical protein [Nostoc sp. FACHB-973]
MTKVISNSRLVYDQSHQFLSWGMGIGHGALGMEHRAWGMEADVAGEEELLIIDSCPIPNPQSPIPKILLPPTAEIV